MLSLTELKVDSYKKLFKLLSDGFVIKSKKNNLYYRIRDVFQYCHSVNADYWEPVKSIQFSDWGFNCFELYETIEVYFDLSTILINSPNTENEMIRNIPSKLFYDYKTHSKYDVPIESLIPEKTQVDEVNLNKTLRQNLFDDTLINFLETKAEKELDKMLNQESMYLSDGVLADPALYRDLGNDNTQPDKTSEPANLLSIESAELHDNTPSSD